MVLHQVLQCTNCTIFLVRLNLKSLSQKSWGIRHVASLVPSISNTFSARMCRASTNDHVIFQLCFFYDLSFYSCSSSTTSSAVPHIFSIINSVASHGCHVYGCLVTKNVLSSLHCFEIIGMMATSAATKNIVSVR